MLEPLLEPAQKRLEKELSNKPLLQKRNLHETARVMAESVIQAISALTLARDTTAVMELFSGQDTPANSDVVDKLSPRVVDALAPRLGISEEAARKMSHLAIPSVLNILNDKVQRAQQNGMNLSADLDKLTHNLSSAIDGSDPQSSRQGQYSPFDALVENLLKQ